jgi:hypothetical protein
VTIGWHFGGIGAPVNVFAVSGAVGWNDFTSRGGIGHDQPVAGQARAADILTVALAVVVNELPFVFDAIASTFIVFAVVQDLILLLARINCRFGSEWQAFVLRGVESLVR